MIRKWKPLLLVSATLTLTACAGLAPTKFHQMSWAKIGVDQASAECLNEVQANPLKSYTRCMEAKGWRPAG